MASAPAFPFAREVKHGFANNKEERGFRPKSMFDVSHDWPTAKPLQLPTHKQETKNNKGREEERLVMLVSVGRCCL